MWQISCEQVLTWNSHTVDERISATMALVVEADELLKKIESVERRAHDLAAKWSAQSLFERHEGQVTAAAWRRTCQWAEIWRF